MRPPDLIEKARFAAAPRIRYTILPPNHSSMAPFEVLGEVGELEARKLLHRFADLSPGVEVQIDSTTRALYEEGRGGAPSILVVGDTYNGELRVVWFIGDLMNAISAGLLRAERWGCTIEQH